MSKLIQMNDGGNVYPNICVSLGSIPANTTKKLSWSSTPCGILIIKGNLSSSYAMYAVVGYGVTLGVRFDVTKITSGGSSITVDAIQNEIAINITTSSVNCIVDYVPFYPSIPQLT